MGSASLELPVRSYRVIVALTVIAVLDIRESGWSYGLKPEFFHGSPGLTPARVNYRKKDHQCALT